MKADDKYVLWEWYFQQKFYNFIIKDAALVTVTLHKSSRMLTQSGACGLFPERKDKTFY